MNKKFFAILCLFTLLLGAATNFTFAVSPKKVRSQKAQANQLAGLLPKSEGVAVIDMKRVTTEAVPQLLMGKIDMLAQINNHVEEIKNQIGIDLRQFEQVAAGVNFKPIAGTKQYDFEPIMLARGGFAPNDLMSIAKNAAGAGNYREEKIGERMIYVFSVKQIMQARKSQIVKTPQDEEKFNNMLSRVPSEIALAMFDGSTLAVGTPARIRETFDSKSPRVGSEILTAVNNQPRAMMRFAANVPAGIGQLWNLGNDDEIGKTVNSIRFLSGNMNMENGNTLVTLAAKTYTAQQAPALETTLVGLQIVGKGLLDGVKDQNKQIYAKILDNAKISRAADQVTINMQIANSDIVAIIGKK